MVAALDLLGYADVPVELVDSPALEPDRGAAVADVLKLKQTLKGGPMSYEAKPQVAPEPQPGQQNLEAPCQ